MPTSTYHSVTSRLHPQNHLNSRVIRTIGAGLIAALAMLIFAETPAFAQSPPSPNVLVDDYVSVPKNGSVDIEVLGNDTLPEFRSFDFTGPEFGRISSFTSNAHSKILSFSYRPNPNYVGKDSFYYLVSDNSGRTQHAAVYITVYAALDCATCLIRHEATPINITIGGDGAFNLHFIGDGGVATGPVLPPVKELIKLHAQDSGNVMLFKGTNSISGAQVMISYLSAEQVLHVHTYYPDRHDGSMKPYIFIVDQENEVSHWEW
ncbi:MAG: hypothetical protein F4Z82_04615 [Caldilineaceae bacterium SB0668_bin_21]|nr:hypothetical protein [Caldilineaceae bacterium SB0668_bin_21]MYC23713.1 hypothetical protein [Caldilineaceae bacterium SB0662_bin_25]